MKLYINISSKEEFFLYLPGDLISVDGSYLKIQSVTWEGSINFTLECSTFSREGPIGNIIKIEEYSKSIVPFYEELCKECPHKCCDLCKEYYGWIDKKFVYPGDILRYKDKDIDMEVKAIKLYNNNVMFKSDEYDWMYLADPHIKVISRGPFICFRGLEEYCHMCFVKKCEKCVLKGG